MSKKLYIILPCYNESEVFRSSADTLAALLKEYIARDIVAPTSALCFVDDGSKDDTWAQIEAQCATSPSVIGIKLSRNFGHQSALLSAMESLSGQADLYVTIDVDLQDDPRVIEQMIEKTDRGASIVYGVRDSRKTDSPLKRYTAVGYYRLMKAMGVDIVFNHADFRLFDQRVLTEMLQFRETNLFLRGIFPLVGFPSQTVYYDRAARTAGESKYPIHKMLAFAWEGATSFSIRPIKMVLYMGLFATMIAIGILIWILITYINGSVVQGWTSMIGIITFFGGIQMISIGVIGEYVGKTYKETKKRPRYIIEKTISQQ